MAVADCLLFARSGNKPTNMNAYSHARFGNHLLKISLASRLRPAM